MTYKLNKNAKGPSQTNLQHYDRRTISEVSNSQPINQAHWQAHKTYSTEANLPKSLPSCSAWVTVFRLTQLRCNTLQRDREKGERTTKVLLQAGLDVQTIGCSSLSPSVSAGQASLGFVCYLLLLYLYSSAVVGRHSSEFHACSNTRPFYVMASRQT